MAAAEAVGSVVEAEPGVVGAEEIATAGNESAAVVAAAAEPQHSWPRLLLQLLPWLPWGLGEDCGGILAAVPAAAAAGPVPAALSKSFSPCRWDVVQSLLELG